jgi:hypothetical protein
MVHKKLASKTVSLAILVLVGFGLPFVSYGEELTVKAAGNPAGAASTFPGNTQPVAITVIVTYRGVPVATLQEENFEVLQILQPPDPRACPSSILDVSVLAMGKGAYVLHLTPGTACNSWISGDYNYQILVTQQASTKASFQGQALATVHIP